jgi:hypothetical protein
MVAVLVTATTSPVTIPVVEPTIATVVLLLLHVPKVVTSLNVVVSPEHTCKVPVIFAGNGFTVTTAVIIHVVGNV